MTSQIKHIVPRVHADTPILLAARRVLRSRLLDVEEQLAAVGAELDDDTAAVHQLRVTTRRATAALDALGEALDAKLRGKARRLLRKLRRAAGQARAEDVYLQRMGGVGDGRGDEGRAYVVDQLRRSRQTSREFLLRVVNQRVSTLRKLRRRLVRSLDPSMPLGNGSENGAFYNVRELAGSALTRAADRLHEALGADLREVANIHRLRIAAKRLRYAIQILAPGLPEDSALEVYAGLEELQNRLGELNDHSGFADRLAALAEGAAAKAGADADQTAALAAVLPELAAEEREAVAESQRALVHWLENGEADRLRRTVESLAYAVTPSASCPIAGTNQPESFVPHRRVAAIDVGTNSVRLVIAETDPTVPFRVVEDLKEMTRLGKGLYTTGCLQPAAMEATLTALERMRAAAEEKKVEQIRAVGTSAVREAKNRAEFLELALQRTGIDIEVLDAVDEARFAFSSVAQTFELDDRCVAVADIGGGSTELVLSTGGVIDSIYPLPLGAVRLTELYGDGGSQVSDSPSRGDYRYEEMVGAIGRTLSERLHRSRYSPYMIIGAGGTFTSMARVALNYNNPGAHVRFPFSLGGYEFRRADVARLLDWLRGMPLEDRRRVAGLSSGRAEIIVAGVCIVDRLMHFFGVDRLRVHDGGIRDGLLAQMFDELGVSMRHPRIPGADSIESIREFARKCEYDAAHSEHVAFLALRIFDQLVGRGPGLAGAWSRPENRPLLHAAAIAHDIGMMIDVPRHHRHSYDLLMHAQLPAFSRREIEIIANICRYHRRRGPKRKDPNFSRLGDDDQRIVAHLAGILRIADGLDRTHQKAVSDVTVDVQTGEVTFDVAADSKPRPELRYAAKKADLFEAAFHIKSDIIWTPSTQPDEAEVGVEEEAVGASL